MCPRIRNTESDIPPINKRLREFWGSESSDKISSKTGVNSGTIRGYLNGRQTPSAEFLAATAALGADVNYILTGVHRAVTVADPPPIPQELGQLRDEIVRLREEIAELNAFNKLLQREKLDMAEKIASFTRRASAG